MPVMRRPGGPKSGTNRREMLQQQLDANPNMAAPDGFKIYNQTMNRARTANGVVDTPIAPKPTLERDWTFWDEYKAPILTLGGIASAGLLSGAAAGGAAPGASASSASIGSLSPGVTTGLGSAALPGATTVGAGGGIAPLAASGGLTAGQRAVQSLSGNTMANTVAPNAAPGAGGIDTMDLIKQLAGNSGNPYLRLLMGGGLDILGGLLSGGAEREAFTGPNTNPENVMDMAIRALMGTGNAMSDRARQGVQLRTTFDTPKPISSPGLPFQIAGGLATDPAKQNQDLLNFPGLNLPDNLLNIGGTGQTSRPRSGDPNSEQKGTSQRRPTDPRNK